MAQGDLPQAIYSLHDTEILDAKLSAIANLTPTCRVAQVFDVTEYGALTDAQKIGIDRILSCGFVDLHDGQWARTNLFEYFGPTSVTRTALLALIAS